MSSIQSVQRLDAQCNDFGRPARLGCRKSGAEAGNDDEEARTGSQMSPAFPPEQRRLNGLRMGAAHLPDSQSAEEPQSAPLGSKALVQVPTAAGPVKTPVHRAPVS